VSDGRRKQHLISREEWVVGVTGFRETVVEVGGPDFSGAARVVRSGACIYEEAFGYANLEWRVPFAVDSVFRIASITKPFTSVLVMRLCEAGLLDMEADLGAYLSDIPDAWRPLTIHHLLSHTSGLMHGWDLEGFRHTAGVARTFEEHLERFHHQPLVGPQGGDFHYSGLGYNLVAAAVQAVTGQSYEESLRAHILDPLGLESTRSDDESAVLERRASGYLREKGDLLRAPALHMPQFVGGGNLISTAGDLAAFHTALQDDRLLTAESIETMQTPEVNQYGYGWFLREEDGRQKVSHGGGLPGFVSQFERYPDEDLCVVVFSNVAPAPVKEIAKALGEVAEARG